MLECTFRRINKDKMGGEVTDYQYEQRVERAFTSPSDPASASSVKGQRQTRQ